MTKPRTNLSAVISAARTIQKRFRRCKSRTTRNWTIPWARSITRTLCVFWWKSTRLIKSASTRHTSAALNPRANELKTNAINRSPRKPVVNWMKSWTRNKGRNIRAAINAVSETIVCRWGERADTAAVRSSGKGIAINSKTSSLV